MSKEENSGSPTDEAAVCDGCSEADATSVDACLTEDQTHVVKIAPIARRISESTRRESGLHHGVLDEWQAHELKGLLTSLAGRHAVTTDPDHPNRRSEA